MGFERGLLVALCLLGVARAEPDPKDLKIHQQKSDILRLTKDLADANDARAALEARLDVAEQRLGLRPFRPQVLKSGDPAWGVRPDRVVRLDREGAPPVKVDLRKHLARAPAYVVAFWATWCKPCTSPEEIAALRRLEADLDKLGRPLLGVAVDGLAKVQKHARAAEWFYPIWHREDAHIDWLPEAFMKSVGLGLPLFVVVSGEGELLFWHNTTLSPAVHEEILTAAARARR